jgi:proline dehydrogenase
MKLPFALARRFVADETLDGALPVVRHLNAQGLHVALDLLGEHVTDRAVAEAARDTYIDLVHELAALRARTGREVASGDGQAPAASASGPALGRGVPGGSTHVVRNRISIKLSMMGQRIDPDFCLDNLRQLLSVARAQDVFVRLDMEGSDLTDSTLDLFEAVYPDYPDHVGPVLQAMLKRTSHDVARMCDLGASVRLCKGAYAEPPSVAYQHMDDIRARYIDYMQQLILNARYPGIATHDDRLIDATKEFVAAHGIDRNGFEFQMLYGMRPETQVETVEAGYHMLVYVPYGTEWLPYFSRRLRERKENVWFVMKNFFRR